MISALGTTTQVRLQQLLGDRPEAGRSLPIECTRIRDDRVAVSKEIAGDARQHGHRRDVATRGRTLLYQKLQQDSMPLDAFLSSLEFEGPVLETIAQKQELMDGSGYPRGLRGEDILLTARILAVANTFVALVSPRAYRDAVPIERALDQLLSESKDKYDRHVVAALFHLAENSRELAEITGGA